jgi:hypothetical protein
MALLAPLVATHPPNLRWLIDATVRIWDLSGADYTAELRHELTMLLNDAAVRSFIDAPPSRIRWDNTVTDP